MADARKCKNCGVREDATRPDALCRGRELSKSGHDFEPEPLCRDLVLCALCNRVNNLHKSSEECPDGSGNKFISVSDYKQKCQTPASAGEGQAQAIDQLIANHFPHLIGAETNLPPGISAETVKHMVSSGQIKMRAFAQDVLSKATPPAPDLPDYRKVLERIWDSPWEPDKWSYDLDQVLGKPLKTARQRKAELAAPDLREAAQRVVDYWRGFNTTTITYAGMDASVEMLRAALAGKGN